MPNPYYVEGLRLKNGNDQEIQDFVLQYEEAHVFLKKLEDMIRFLIPNYIAEGKNQLVISIGCTGGKHRSVTLANELYKRLSMKENAGSDTDPEQEKTRRPIMDLKSNTVICLRIHSINRTGVILRKFLATDNRRYERCRFQVK